MGAEVEERDDGLKIPGGQSLHGTELESFNDHRIAMAFSIAGLRAQGETLIHGSRCAAISYPSSFPYWRASSSAEERELSTAR